MTAGTGRGATATAGAGPGWLARLAGGCRGGPSGCGSPCSTAGCSWSPARGCCVITYLLVATQPAGGRPRDRVAAPRRRASCCRRAAAAAAAGGRSAGRARQRSGRRAAPRPDQLLIESGIALAIMAVLSVGLGWLVAGRVLRPLRTITATARRISASSLHERLALTGPDDELKELGDTFDELLARLEGAFDAQRQFVANASHELRTPLARQRTLIEVALATRSPATASLRAACGRALAAGEQQERLIDALLTLARSERGLRAREPSTWAPSPATCWRPDGTRRERAGLTVTADLGPRRRRATRAGRTAGGQPGRQRDPAQRRRRLGRAPGTGTRRPGRARGDQQRPGDPAGAGRPAVPAVPAAGEDRVGSPAAAAWGWPS